MFPVSTPLWDVASCRKAQGKCLATRSLPPAVAGPAPAWRRVSLSLPARRSYLCIAPLVIRSRRAMAPKKDDKKGAAKPKAGSGGGKAKKKVRSAAPPSRFGSVADWIASPVMLRRRCALRTRGAESCRGM